MIIVVPSNVLNRSIYKDYFKHVELNLQLATLVEFMKVVRLEPTKYITSNDGTEAWFEHDVTPGKEWQALISKLLYHFNRDPLGGLNIVKRLCTSQNKWFTSNRNLYKLPEREHEALKKCWAAIA